MVPVCPAMILAVQCAQQTIEYAHHAAAIQSTREASKFSTVHITYAQAAASHIVKSVLLTILFVEGVV